MENWSTHTRVIYINSHTPGITWPSFQFSVHGLRARRPPSWILRLTAAFEGPLSWPPRWDGGKRLSYSYSWNGTAKGWFMMILSCIDHDIREWSIHDFLQIQVCFLPDICPCRNQGPIGPPAIPPKKGRRRPRKQVGSPRVKRGSQHMLQLAVLTRDNLGQQPEVRMGQQRRKAGDKEPPGMGWLTWGRRRGQVNLPKTCISI